MSILLLTSLAVATPNPDFTHRFGERYTENVAMPDGVTLDTRVALPKGDGPWPTILIRNPYPIDRYLDRICRQYVRYGYACVQQKVRGQGDSGGEWSPFTSERADGLATLDWLIAQPWSDDSIALMGASYMAGVQWAMADVLPPEVKTIIPSVFGMEMYRNAYEGGLFRHELVTAWMTLIPDHRFRPFAGRDYQRAIQHRPRIEADVVAAGVEVPWFRAWMEAQERSVGVWQSPAVLEANGIPERITVPVLMMGGWSDIFIDAQLSTWARLASQSDSTLVIGPWDHLGSSDADVEMANIDDLIGLEDSYSQTRRTLDWLDHHLKGAPAQLPVGQTLVYTMGADTWHVAPSWPPPTTPQTWTATDGDAAHCIAPLSTDATALSPTHYDYDPANPTPSLGGAGSIAGVLSPGFGGVPIGLRDQERLCSKRDDMIGWRTAPLTEPLRIAGGITATLTVSSSAADTAFNVRIVEIRPDGTQLHVREGIRALSFRDGDEHRVEYTPDEPVELVVETWPIDFQFQAGSRILVEIASASFPKFEAHANTTEYWADAVETVIATQTIHALSVSLPVVE
ncbi:MAG: putative CocE/NonD family hydrolase [Myxococcota bacterium]|jgi:putative CocE/NonD family hydrolase